MRMPQDEEKKPRPGEKPPKPEAGFSDVVAMIIAMFQLIVPAMVVFIGIAWVVYLLLKVWAK